MSNEDTNGVQCATTRHTTCINPATGRVSKSAVEVKCTIKDFAKRYHTSHTWLLFGSSCGSV